MIENGEKVYLGDGLYLQFDGYHLVLSAENGVVATNTVYLEPPVYKALVERVENSQLEAFKRK